jgi:hypothetical protein
MDAVDAAEKDANLTHLEKTDSSSSNPDIENSADQPQDWTAQEEKKLKLVPGFVTIFRWSC